MQRLPSVHPSDTNLYPNGIGTFDVGAADAGSKILMYNESPQNIDLDFLNGSTDVLHAWEANWWLLDGDTKQIEWQIDADSLNVVTPPVSAVFMTLYGPQERIAGTYPMALVRQASIGNTVSTVGGAANSIQNDANAGGTSIMEATVSGQAVSTVSLTNDGLMALAVIVAAAIVQILKTNTMDPLLQLGAANHIVEVLGQLQVDQNLGVRTNANGTISLIIDTKADANRGLVVFMHNATQTADLLQCEDNNFNRLFSIGPSGNVTADAGAISTDGTGNLALATWQKAIQLTNQAGGRVNVLNIDSTNSLNLWNSAAGVQLNMKDQSGKNMAAFSTDQSTPASVDATCQMTVAKLFLNTGGFKDVNFFTGTGSGTYNHGLSGTPTWVAPIVDQAGSATQGYDSGNSTQVHITLGASLTFKAFATR